MKKLFIPAVLAALVCSAPQSQAQVVTLTGGSADLTFYYQSGSDTWRTLVRHKTGTAGSGFTNIWTPFTGAVGTQIPGSPGQNGDYVFSTLTTVINSNTQFTIGANTFWVSSKAGTPTLLNNPAVPDLGIRTRLREDEVALGNPSGNPLANQFDSVNFTLDLTLSTFNGNPLSNAGSPHVAFFTVTGDPFVADTADTAYLNTGVNDLVSNWGNYTHQHRHWGFSELGDYSLVFNINGVGGSYGAIASTGQFTADFQVIPEPAAAIFFGLAALAYVVRRRMIK